MGGPWGTKRWLRVVILHERKSHRIGIGYVCDYKMCLQWIYL